MKCKNEFNEDEGKLDNEKVYIKRQLSSGDGAIVPLGLIRDSLRSTYVSGGYNISLRKRYPCAYVKPEEVEPYGHIACSGRHNYSNNGIKVLIMKSGSSKAAYKYIMSVTGLDEKDLSTAISKGAPPCTKRIVQIVNDNNGEMLRGELREKIHEEGYKVSFAQALKTLIKTGKIKTEGAAQSKYQKVIACNK